MLRLHLPAILLLVLLTGSAAARQMPRESLSDRTGAPPMTTLAVSLDGAVLAGAPSGVYRSTNAGHSWVSHDQGLTGLGRIVRTVLVDAEGTEWLGTEGGVYRREASGASWILAGLAGQRVNSIAVTERIVFAGTTSGVARSMDGGASWTHHPVSASRPAVRSVTAHGSMVLAGTPEGVRVSHDAGSSWAPAGPGLDGADVTALIRVFSGSHFVASRNQDAPCTLYRTRSDGGLWSCVAPDEIRFRVEAIAQAADGRLVVAGDHWVAMSRDEGHSWTVQEAGSSMVRAVVAVGSTVLAGTSDTGILRSEGSAFVPSNEGLAEGWARVDLIALESMKTSVPTVAPY